MHWVIINNDVDNKNRTYAMQLPNGTLIRTESWESYGKGKSIALCFIPGTKLIDSPSGQYLV